MGMVGPALGLLPELKPLTRGPLEEPVTVRAFAEPRGCLKPPLFPSIEDSHWPENEPRGLLVIVVVVLVTQSCLTLCDPTDCSLPGSSVHRILQARILEWVAISFYRDRLARKQFFSNNAWISSFLYPCSA